MHHAGICDTNDFGKLNVELEKHTMSVRVTEIYPRFSDIQADEEILGSPRKMPNSAAIAGLAATSAEGTIRPSSL